MAKQKVLITINLNVNPPAPPPPPPLVASPTSVTLSDETVGVDPGTVQISALSGGTPPFNVSVDESSPNPLPPGQSASIDANGNVVLTGAPQAAGSGQVVLAVEDSGV